MNAVSDRELARILDEQIEAMQAVRDALEAERAALSARDGDALLAAVNGKAGAIASAESLEWRRQEALARLGLGDRFPRAGRAFSADSGIGQRWQQVLALTEQCRALNEANGQMVRGQRRRVDGALRVLRGEAVATTEYGPGGEERPRATQRSLGCF
jgi:flagella synthesis protein FlgN